jgi:Glycosyl transferase family 2/Methyltransferase domain
LITAEAVTVVIPSLPERFASRQRAIRSVERQTTPPAGIAVRVDYQRAGAAAARNAALAKVRTPWVAFLDDDDTFHRNHLEVLIGAANRSGADLVSSNAAPAEPNMRDALVCCWKGIPVVGPVNVRWGPEQLDHLDARRGRRCPHCGTPRGSYIMVTNLVRTELVEKVGGFPAGGSMGQDFAGWAAEDYLFLLKLLDVGARFHHVTGQRTWTRFHRGHDSEGRFTAARSDCPHPERWHSMDEDSTEVEVSELVAAMVTALQPDLVVETGTAFGQTAELIGRALKRNGQGRLVTLEVDPDRVQAAKERCHGLPVEVVQASSVEWSLPGPVDFAWFDSLCHLRPVEFRRWLPWMHDRTVVGFHDTGPQHPVRGLLRPLEDEGLLAPMYLPTPRGVCFARVTPNPIKERSHDG